MKKKRVIYVAPLPPPFGGIANWTRLLLSYLEREKKDEIAFFVLDSSPKKRVTEGRGVFSRVFFGGISMIHMVRKLRKRLEDEKTDAVHITTSGSLALLRDFFLIKTAKKKKVRTVYHIHFGRLPLLFQKKGWEYGLLRHNLKNSSNIVVIDKSTEAVLKKNGYEKKTFYIPNGIDLKELPPDPQNRKNIVTYAGWLIKEKGIRELISAWKQLDAKVKKGWFLRLIGPYREDFIEKLKLEEEEDIVLLGEKTHEETLNFINEGKIFVLPSYSEGFPYSVLEAMALEQRILATRVGDIEEMLSKDCGRMIPPKSETELVEALADEMQKKASSMGERARKKVEENYSISRIYERYHTLYSDERMV